MIEDLFKGDCLECDSPADTFTIGDGKCNVCHGSGIEDFGDAAFSTMVGGDGKNCTRCGGTGVCPRCEGEGRHWSRKDQQDATVAPEYRSRQSADYDADDDRSESDSTLGGSYSKHAKERETIKRGKKNSFGKALLKGIGFVALGVVVLGILSQAAENKTNDDDKDK